MEKVKVLIRIRENDQNKTLFIDQEKKRIQLAKYQNNVFKNFEFDQIYTREDTNQIIFNDHCSNLINQCIDGFNGTILVYGQSGTGKTFTLNGNESNKGLIELSLENLFILNENFNEKKFSIKISCLEIYNETITDLLKTKSSEKVEIYENSKEEIVYKNLTQCECLNLNDCLKQYQSSLKKRTTTSTSLNSTSSRSHFILILDIEVEYFDSKLNMNIKKNSKLNFVDLAGSERQKKTNARGIQLNEASKINNSLTVLGNVISALNSKSNFVPFRNSKLTRLLQGSLGNNSKTILMSCISSRFSDCVETESTLNFSAKAKNIKNKPVVNLVYSDLQIKLDSLGQKSSSQLPLSFPNLAIKKHHMICDFCLKRTDSGQFKLKKPRRPNKKMIDFIKEYNKEYRHINMKLHNNCYFKLAKLTK